MKQKIMFAKQRTVMEVEMKIALCSRASGHGKQTACKPIIPFTQYLIKAEQRPYVCKAAAL